MRFAPLIALSLSIGLVAAAGHFGAGFPGVRDRTPAEPAVSRHAKPVRPSGRALPTPGKPLPGPFHAEILSVIDGDTLEARVTVRLGQTVETRVRLRGIDAAEMSSECAEERDLARISQAALRRFVAAGPVYLADITRDKYGGRVVATVLDGTGTDVGTYMLREGYAIAYDGGRRQPWCDAAPTLTARR